jgi:hypothetical protein
MGGWRCGCCDGRILLRIGQLPVLSPAIKCYVWEVGAGYSPAPLFHSQFIGREGSRRISRSCRSFGASLTNCGINCLGTGLRRTAGMGCHENLCSINVYALITYECCVSPTRSRVGGKCEYIDRETGRRHRARRRATRETERTRCAIQGCAGYNEKADCSFRPLGRRSADANRSRCKKETAIS